jgi:hypothetical protein
MNRPPSRQCGAVLLVASLLLMLAIGFVFAVELAAPASESSRRRATERALAEAREALLAYAADRAITAVVGPGYLPCPDLDNDGWAEPTCGSLSGDSGQAERLGRLPWKTLGLADLRDGDGERLWYAVSTKYKGLLNCAASAACVDMSPEAALGTISVRDPSGTLLHDAVIEEPYRAGEGGAAAVVIAPGAPLMRVDGAGDAGRMQSRACGAGDCDERGRCVTDPPRRAAPCDPANYLDKASAARFAWEDNADFVDRSDARAGNRNGFIQGPVTLSDGRLAVNDRIAVVAYRDVMPRIMRRVALEAASCLRAHAAAGGRYPWPAPVCAQAAGGTSAWLGATDVHFGRIADQGWDAACNLTAPASHSWWKAWRANVFYALARESAPLELVDANGRAAARDRAAAVIVAGPPLVREGFVQHRDGALGDVRQWLEGGNALLEGAAGCATAPAFSCEAAGTCARVTVAAATRGFNDVVVALP